MRHEITHTRRNHREFVNVSSNLKERRKRDPNRLEPRPIFDHSDTRSEAQPLGRRQAGKQSAGKIKKEKVDKDLAYREKVKRTLEQDKKIKKEIKVELPCENDSGFKLGDYVKGNFKLPRSTAKVLLCICGIRFGSGSGALTEA